MKTRTSTMKSGVNKTHVRKATKHIEWRGKKITAFEKSVYELISTIPKGRVSTYGDVAKQLQSAPRSVGNALRRNPFAPEVPCHRIVAATGAIGGFSGSTGEASPNIIKKRRMLREEGVEFDDNHKVKATCMHAF